MMDRVLLRLPAIMPRSQEGCSWSRSAVSDKGMLVVVDR